jgi:hypothetical protein
MLMVKGKRIQSNHFAILVKLKRIIKEFEIQKSDEDFDNAFADIFGGTKISSSLKGKRIHSR